MTGADSPVIADSSTLAMPSTTSPSPGMICPASTTTRSPTPQLGAGDRLLACRPGVSRAGPWSSVCGRAQRCGLGLAAALGDGLGQVGEDDGQPQPGRDRPGEHAGVGDGQHGGDRRRPTQHDEHDRGAPLVPRVRACAAASGSDGEPAAAGRNGLAARGRCRGGGRPWWQRWCVGLIAGPSASGAEGEGGEEGQGDDDHRRRRRSRPTNSGRWVGSVPADAGTRPLPGQRAGQGEHQDDRQEPAEQHRQAQRGVLAGRCSTREPGERASRCCWPPR